MFFPLLHWASSFVLRPAATDSRKPESGDKYDADDEGSDSRSPSMYFNAEETMSRFFHSESELDKDEKVTKGLGTRPNNRRTSFAEDEIEWCEASLRQRDKEKRASSSSPSYIRVSKRSSREIDLKSKPSRRWSFDSTGSFADKALRRRTTLWFDEDAAPPVAFPILPERIPHKGHSNSRLSPTSYSRPYVEDNDEISRELKSSRRDRGIYEDSFIGFVNTNDGSLPLNTDTDSESSLTQRFKIPRKPVPSNGILKPGASSIQNETDLRKTVYFNSSSENMPISSSHQSVHSNYKGRSISRPISSATTLASARSPPIVGPQSQTTRNHRHGRPLKTVNLEEKVLRLPSDLTIPINFLRRPSEFIVSIPKKYDAVLQCPPPTSQEELPTGKLSSSRNLSYKRLRKYTTDRLRILNVGRLDAGTKKTETQKRNSAERGNRSEEMGNQMGVYLPTRHTTNRERGSGSFQEFFLAKTFTVPYEFCLCVRSNRWDREKTIWKLGLKRNCRKCLRR